MGPGDQVRESYDDLKASAASQAKADGKSGAGASSPQDSAADAQSASQSQQQQQQPPGTSSSEEPPGGPGFAASGADASSSGMRCRAAHHATFQNWQSTSTVHPQQIQIRIVLFRSSALPPSIAKKLLACRRLQAQM